MTADPNAIAIPSNGRCRSCGAPVIWVTTSEGKSMPVDPDIEHGGNVYLQAMGNGEIYAVVGKPSAEERGRLSHFATCPHAEKWRRR